MRGFRGSRAALNQLSARFGRNEQNHSQNQAKDAHVSEHSGETAQHQPKGLPDWLKTPETRAREAQEAREAALRPAPQAVQPSWQKKPEQQPQKPAMPRALQSVPKPVHSQPGAHKNPATTPVASKPLHIQAPAQAAAPRPLHAEKKAEKPRAQVRASAKPKAKATTRAKSGKAKAKPAARVSAAKKRKAA